MVMKDIKLVVSRETYNSLGATYKWSLPLLKRYAAWIPSQAFALGEDDVFIAEHPEYVVFRQRFTFKRCKRKIRTAIIRHDDYDGKDEITIQLYLI